MTLEHAAKQVVVGMGNVLLKDEGIGVHVARTLQEEILPSDSGLEVIDGATSPDVFLSLKGSAKVIVVDAMEAGDVPGAIYRFRPSEVSSYGRIALSAHQGNLLEELRLLNEIGQGPQEVVVIGVQPKEIGWGLELSPELQKQVPCVARLVLEEAGLLAPISLRKDCEK